MSVRPFVIVMLLFLPLAATAAEFMDDDVLPKQEKVEFEKDKLYFDTVIYDPTAHEIWYSFDRKTHELVQLDSRPPLQTAGYMPRAQLHGPCEFHLQTSDGKTYSACLPDCEDGINKPGSLTDLDTGETFFAHTPSCVGPGTVERFGDKLLVGAWESGDYSLAVSPVSVLDGKTHRLLKSFDFAANVIRRDPYTPQVWLVGTEGAMLLDADLNLKQRWYFYKGFRLGDHAVAVLVSDTPRKTEALSVVGAELHVPDQEAWYQAVSALPTNAREGFSLYGFYMSGGFPPYYPTELDPLVPFFIDAAFREQGGTYIGRALENLCRFDDPRAVEYLDKLAKSAHPFAGYADRCLAAHRKSNPKVSGEP